MFLGRPRLRRLATGVGICSLALLVSAVVLTPPPRAEAAPIPSTFTLDGVTVTLSTAFLAGASYQVAQPTALVQTAVSSAVRPYRALTLQAIPMGTTAPGEGLPKASAGGAPNDLTKLKGQRHAEGGAPAPATPVEMFGTQARGILSRVSLAVTTHGKSPVAIAEWVVASAQRIWILRADEQLTGSLTVPEFAAQLQGTTVTTVGTPPSPATPARTNAMVTPLTTGTNAPWWNGVCDVGNNHDGTPLGAVFQGFAACGPRPFTESPPGSDDYAVQFFPGAWGEFEFECVELAMRYLYLTYGIDPYPANGNQVVTKYPGIELEKISNGTPGESPEPGDIISFGADTADGHDAVVSGNNVNAVGDGTITVIEENNSATGSNTLTVSNWVVGADAYPTIGWLHKPAVPAAAPSPQGADSGVASYGAQMQAFVRDSDNALEQRFWSRMWSGWNSFGGVLEDQPTVIQYGADLFAFARGSNSGLWYRSYSPSAGWSGWGTLGGVLVGDPIAVDYGSQLQLFVLGLHGIVYQNYSHNGSVWSGWVSMGGTLASNPTLATSAGDLDVFARGTDSAVWEKQYNPAKGGWTGWRSLGGSILGTPDAVRYTGAGANAVEVVVRGLGNALYADLDTSGSETWRGWVGLGGSVAGDPAAVVYGSQLQVFGMGTDSTLRQTFYAPGVGWVGWTSLGGGITEGPWPVVWDDRLDVLVRGTDGAVWDRFYDPSAGHWQAWASLGGSVHT